MRVTPGQQIPFWLKIWDGNPSLFIVAHVTNLDGVEQPGSPVTLTYSGNRGIYTGVGPVIGISDMRIDYEVFNDVGLTLASKKYLPSWEEVEADISNSEVLSQILGKLINVDPNTVVGYIDTTVIQGTVEDSNLSGEVLISDSQGTVESDTLQGVVDNSTITGGEVI